MIRFSTKTILSLLIAVISVNQIFGNGDDTYSDDAHSMASTDPVDIILFMFFG